MNFTEMLSFVRTHADTDVTDAPTETLTVYARAAYNDIRRRVAPWLDNFTSDTLTVISGTSSYALSGAQFSTANLEYVTSVVGPTDVLQYVPFNVYQELVDGDEVSYSTAEATHWTARGGTLYLWPEPSTADTYAVWGYKTFSDWPSGNSEPTDLPREFDEPICWFMLSRYYGGQEDIELMQIYNNMYEVAVGRFLASMMKNAQPQRVFGRGSGMRRMTYADWMRRNTEGV